MIRAFFTEFLYRPLFNALAWLYQGIALEDLGLAIILLTLAVRILLFPLFHKTVKHQQITQNLQPQIKQIQKKHKDDKETQAKEILGLYSDHKINPLTPLLALIIQLPIIFILYRIFINGFSNGALDLLYPFIELPTSPNQTLLGLVDLTEPSVLIALVAAALQYAQGKLSLAKSKGESRAEKIGRKMVFIMPAITLVILYNLPAGIGIYWATTTLFSVFQQYLVSRTLNKKGDGGVSLAENGTDKAEDPKST